VTGGSAERLHRAWIVLVKPVGNEFASFALDPARGVRSLRAAMDAHGRQHLLVPHDDASAALSGGARGALSISSRSLTFDGHAATYVDVVCHDPSLRREFDQICLDILDAYAEDGPKSGAAVVAQVVNRWRRLLRTIRGRGLSPEERVGLFAELSVLRSLVATDSASSANWTGPDKRPHDFEFDCVSLEVKGLGATANDIVVHGLDQLQELNGKALFIVLVDVEQDDTGERLADVVAELQKLLGTRDGLMAKLNIMGFEDNDDDLTRYAIGALHLGRVTDGVPRLVASDIVGGVPEGLSRISYHIDRGALLPMLKPIELGDLHGYVS
jgi:hypothetical protein